MSGGPFRLTTNDGKLDRAITASELLLQRIKDVSCQRRADGKEDVEPTLGDIERTHILFVNAHYKPFAATTFEYIKVSPHSGSVTSLTGSKSTVTFSIPQAGDFFSDMVFHIQLGAASTSTLTAPTQAGTSFNLGGNTIPANTVASGGTTALFYSLASAYGGTVAAASAYTNLLRYCEYPGERLVQLAKFDVNNNPLDEYDDMTVVMLRKFTVSPGKEDGYKRLVGQEVELEGYGRLFCTPGVSNAVTNTPAGPMGQMAPNTSGAVGDDAAAFTYNSMYMTDLELQATGGSAAPSEAGLVGTSAASTNEPSDATGEIFRYRNWVLDGAQTPKVATTAQDFWVPLWFYCCQDPRVAIPSVSIPYGQRFITLDLAPKTDLVTEEPNLYVRVMRDTGYAAATGSGTAALGAPAEVTNRVSTYVRWNRFGTVADITVNKLELYINNIYLLPEVHDIYIKKIGFTLVRVYRRQKQTVNKASSDELLLSNIKYAVEYLFIGIRPTWNVNSNNRRRDVEWHRFTKFMELEHDRFDYAELSKGIFATHAVTSATGGNLTSAPVAGDALPGAVSIMGQVYKDKHSVPVRTIDTLQVQAHGIDLYGAWDWQLYNAYLPFTFGGQNIRTPSDPGALMVNFALFPRTYQPSGHLNVSRARELYAKWTTSYLNSSKTGDFVAVAVAINFLLISDGSAVLRYST